MLEEQLIQYGALGLFVLYLIYDRQVVMPKLIKSIDRNTDVINRLCQRLGRAEDLLK